MSVASYIFSNDPRTGAMSPEAMKRQRAIAQALFQDAAGSQPKDLGSGLSAIGKALLARSAMAKAEKGEAFAADKQKGLWSDLTAAIGSGGGSALSYDPAGAAAPSGTADVGAPSPAKVMDLSGDKKTFVDTLMPAAMEASQRTGVDPRIIVAQAAQETGWGRSAPGNNYFGIKSHGKDGGQNLATEEVIDGKRVKVRDSFRTFASPGDSVAGYADFLLDNPRYGKMRAAQGLDAQLDALGASGYATDPNYSSSVGAIARGIQLPSGPQASAAPTPAQQPVQVASLDPSIGADSALAYDPRGKMGAPAPNQPNGKDAAVAAALAPLPPAQTVEPNPVPPKFSPAVMQALGIDPGFDGFARSGGDVQGAPAPPADPNGPAPAIAGPVPASAPVAPQAGGMNPQALMAVISDPYASEEQRQIASSMLSQAMKPKQYGFSTMPDGTVLRQDPRTGQVSQAYKADVKLMVVGDKLVNPVTGEVVFSGGKNTTLSEGQTLVDENGRTIASGATKPVGGFDDEQKLRKEYISTPEAKEYSDIRSSYERLRASAETGSGPGDLGVIFGYMKMLDPGSVVREGEFATAENAQGVPAYVSNLYNKLLTGERLSPDQRSSFVTAAGGLYGKVEAKMRGINDRFSTIAGQYNIDPMRVIQSLPTYEPLKLGDAAAPPQPSVAPAPTPAIPKADGVPDGIDPEDWKMLTPEERKLWLN